MNSVLVLAAIVGVVLLVAVLLLKKRTAAKKAAQVEAVDQAETAVQARVAVPAPPGGISPAERDEAGAGEAVAPSVEVAAGAQPAETIVPVVEPVAGAAAAIPAAAREDEPVITGPIAVVPSSEKATSTGFTEAPVVPEGTDSFPTAQEEVAEPLLVAQPEVCKEEEPVLVMEAAAPDSESVAVTPPAPEVVVVGVPEEPGESVPAVGALPRISLTLEAYSARLNLLEEKQRALLVQAMQRRDDKQRDQLQRELVLMNDKLALLADSYAAEMACYQQILGVLEQLQGDGDGVECAAATEALQKGEPQAAETLFARLSEQQNPFFAAQAAFHSGQLAECRVDLQNALHL